MSNANEVTYFLKEQSAYGTQATGNFATVRAMGDGMKHETESVESDELGSRRVTDVARTWRRAAGPWRQRFSFGNSDELLRGALCAPEVAAWSTPVTSTLSGTKTLQAIAAGNVLRTAGAAKIDWSTYDNGRWMRIQGFTTNNPTGQTEFRCRKVSHAGDDCTVDNVTLVNEAAISTGEVEQGAYITDGSSAHFYSIERKYGDLTQFRMHTDMFVNGVSGSVNAKGLFELTFDMLGKQFDYATASEAGTPTAKTTGRLINGVDHVRGVLASGTRFSMSDFSFQQTNNGRERAVFGNLGAESIGLGQNNCTVGIDGYYATNTLLALYDAFTDTSMGLDISDAGGNSMILHWPNGNFTDGSATPEGNNTDVRQPMQFRSKEYTLGALVMQMQIAKWAV